VVYAFNAQRTAKSPHRQLSQFPPLSSGGSGRLSADAVFITFMAAAEDKPANHAFDPPAEVLIVDNDQSHADTVAESLERVASLPCGRFRQTKGRG